MPGGLEQDECMSPAPLHLMYAPGGEGERIGWAGFRRHAAAGPSRRPAAGTESGEADAPSQLTVRSSDISLLFLLQDQGCGVELEVFPGIRSHRRRGATLPDPRHAPRNRKPGAGSGISASVFPGGIHPAPIPLRIATAARFSERGSSLKQEAGSALERPGMKGSCADEGYD